MTAATIVDALTLTGVPGIAVVRTPSGVRVTLDDIEDGQTARDVFTTLIPAGQVTDALDYVGSGMVRAEWNTLVDGIHVTVTDTAQFSEWSHRLNDIRGLDNAELADLLDGGW